MKRLLLLLLIPLIFSLESFGATAFVQSKSAVDFSETLHTVTFDSDVTAGNGIGVYYFWGSITFTTDGVTDTLTNSYTLLHNPTLGAGTSAGMAYTLNITGGTCTVTFETSDAVSGVIYVEEFSGAAPSGALDKSALLFQTDPGTGTDAISSGSVTTTVDGEYIFGATHDEGQSSVVSPGTGFTGRETTTGGRLEDQVQASAGSIAAAFTGDLSFADFLTGIMTFKPVAAAEKIEVQGGVEFLGGVEIP